VSRPVYICLPPARTLHGSCGIYHTTLIAAGRCRDAFNRSADGNARGGREVFAYDGADGPRGLLPAEAALLPK
jgi:hypothetical protein